MQPEKQLTGRVKVLHGHEKTVAQLSACWQLWAISSGATTESPTITITFQYVW